MSQHIPQSGQELFSLPDFRDDRDLFDDEESVLVAHPTRRRILILLSAVVLALLVIGAVLFIKYRTHIIYQMKRVVQSDLVLSINTTGSLRTNVYTVNVAGGGKLATITVTVGQQVKKGQILATLDPTSLQNALDEAQLNVEAAQTALDNANANYEAIQSARSSNSISISSAHSSFSPQSSQPSITPRGTYVVQETEARGQIRAARRGLALAQAELDMAKYNLNNASLRAPHDGTVATINGVVGGEAGATFIQIVDPSSLQLQANVNESDISAVAIGDGVSFSVDAYPGQSFNGNVITISPLSQSIAGSVTYPVWVNIVSIVPASVHLLPGMTAHTTITTKERTGVLVVPASALAFARAAEKPRAETNNQSIIEYAKLRHALSKASTMLKNEQQDVSQENPAPAVVLERDVYDKIIAVPIVVGLTDGREYEVLDGLSVNDMVLIGARTGSN
jgi:HlyD family secretion protein